MKHLVIIRGAGDMATGIAQRLYAAGFAILMTEIACPTVIRRTVSFAQAVFSGQVTVEGITAVLSDEQDAKKQLAAGHIPVVIDPDGTVIDRFKPLAVVDAILAKVNTGTRREAAPLVIGVGPGFTAGQDVDAVIESMRGHYLGRVIREGTALADTGVPGEIGGYGAERIVRSPAGGIFTGAVPIGRQVLAGEKLGQIAGADGSCYEVTATIAGILRGLLQDGLRVPKGMKIGDIDPRCVAEHCFSISDKARAIGGGVLEAVCFHLNESQKA